MHSQLLSPLDATLVREATRWFDRPIWRLDQPLFYHSAVLGSLIEIPAGTQTDLASVPRLPLVWLLAGGNISAPAVVHDYLYQTKPCSRRAADDVLFEAMTVTGHPWLERALVWAGVRVGGWVAWSSTIPPAAE